MPAIFYTTPMISRTACERLATALSADAAVVGLTPLAGGVSATVGLLELRAASGERQRVVVRQHGADHGGLDATTEARLLEALHAAGLGVPAVRLVDADARLLERPGLVLEHMIGTSEVSASELPHAIRTMVQVLLDVHRFPTERLPALPQRLDPVPKLLDLLPEGRRWARLRGALLGQQDTTYGEAPKLLHGDYWPENLLWRDGDLVAVLDWEDAALGDPLADVAGAGLELRIRHGRAEMEAFIEGYGRFGAVEVKRLALWQLYVSAAMLRFMPGWGLSAAEQVATRSAALATLEEAAAVVLAQP